MGNALDPVQLGVSLALEAHRRGLMDDRALDAVLAYYDNEGARDPFPADEVLIKLGGVPPAEAERLVHGAPPTPSDIQGEKFNDRLTLLEPIGEGGMGSVWRAYDRVLKRVVAIKKLRLDHLDPGALSRVTVRFEREAHAMARVRHPACVPIYDAGLSSDGAPYLVMEFVPGKSLRGLLEESPRAGPKQVAEWGIAVADALQACHDVGLIHRDVKPANILLDARGKPHLTDFGVALDDRAQTKITVDKAVVGTLCYMPPEQALGERVDARSDVYSLGATLFEALTGRPPFDSPATLVLLRQVIDEFSPAVRTYRRDCPEDLATIVEKCIAKPRADRYATAQALALDLRRFLADEPVLATRISPVQRVGRRLWRQRRLLGAGLAVAAVVATGLFAQRVRAREQRRAAIESALSAAAVASDLDAAETAVLERLAAAEPDQAERGREALRRLRARRRLREAEAAVERWRDLARREQACLDEADPLRERIVPEEPFAESPDKQRLAALEQEQELLNEQVLTALFDAERLMARAAAEDPALPGVPVLRAQLLIDRGRLIEDGDPEAAERLFQQALALDPTAADLADPVLTVASDPPGAACVLWRYRFDATKGYMVPEEVARGTTPARLVGRGCGDYLLELTADDRLPTRDLLQLTRGQTRDKTYDLPSRSALGPLAEFVVWIPPGEARWGANLRGRSQVEGFYCSIDECPNEQWRSFMLAKDLGPEYAPFSPDAPRPAPGSFPVTDVSWSEVQEFLAWLQSEVDLAGLPFKVEPLTPERFHRAVRGEFAWLFPWGPRFDATFCESGEFSNAAAFGTMRRLARVDDTRDISTFGVRRLAGGARERVAIDPGSSAALGGAISLARRTLLDWMTTSGYFYSDTGVPDATHRWALTPRTRQSIRSTSDLTMWKARAQSRRERGDYWGALWDYTITLRHAPSDEVALINRAATQYHRRALGPALTDIARALDVAPLRVEAWALRAMIRAERGDFAGADADLAEGRRRDPTNATLRESERRIQALRR